MGRSKDTKLFHYIKTGSLHRVRSLLTKYKLDLNEIVDDNGRTPLHVACILGDDAVVRLLLEYGAHTEVRDHSDNTPLHLAIKSGLELLNPNLYQDVVKPLIRASNKNILQFSNSEGQTVDSLLVKLKHFVEREKQERQSRLEEEERIFKERQAKREEDREWNEKLRHEFECEDFYLRENCDEFISEPRFETYDVWAERIQNERREKLWKMKDERDKVRKQRESEQVELEARERTRKLESEHLAYLQLMKERSRINKSSVMKQNYEERCRDVFQDTTEKQELHFAEIPWPCKGSAEKIVKVLVDWAEMEGNEEGKKKYLKEQQVRWHPDRFMQRCGERLSEDDKQQILGRVKEISQHLNALSK